MKKIWQSKLFFYSLSVLPLSLLFLFGLIRQSNAATEIFVNQSSNTCGYGCIQSSTKQSFIAYQNNLNRVDILSAIQYGGYIYATICETNVVTNATCLGSETTIGSVYVENDGTLNWRTITPSEPIPLNQGAYYLINITRGGGGNWWIGYADNYGGGYGFKDGSPTNTDDVAIKLYYDDTIISGAVLGITDVYFIDSNVLIQGTCKTYGSGYHQMTMGIATNSDAAYNDDYLYDPFSRGYFVDCIGDSFGTTYYGFDLTGTSTIYINDSFFHPTSSPNMVSIDQNFTIIPEKEWEFSVGYMSEDNPEYTARNLACTSEEWDSENWWTEFRCNIAKRFYIASFGARDWARDNIKSKGSVMSNLFPYSLSKDIETSWESSASSTMPTSLAWLDVADSQGNVKIQMFNSATTTTIWGPDIFGNNTTTTAAFTNIKNITTYILYGLFILWIIYIAVQVKNHLHF